MNVEARDAILYGQIQDGLSVELMKSPSVSSAMSYKELCMTVRNEEGRQAELQKYRNYRKIDPLHLELINMQKNIYQNGNSEGLRPKPVYFSICYKCNKVGHLAKDCRMKKSESHGGKKDQRGKSEGSNQVRVTRMNDVKPDTP